MLSNHGAFGVLRRRFNDAFFFFDYNIFCLYSTNFSKHFYTKKIAHINVLIFLKTSLSDFDSV